MGQILQFTQADSSGYRWATGHETPAPAPARRRYLSCAETAALVRIALKRDFPGVKFSVRSHVYSMGASIDVGWTDGPLASEVERTAKQFAGSDFDGMIDLKVSSTAWLLNGEVYAGSSPGTVGSRGVIEGWDEPSPGPGAELVHFGCDYVFCTRELSSAERARLEALIAGADGGPFDPNKRYDVAIGDRVYQDYGSSVLWRLSGDGA